MQYLTLINQAVWEMRKKTEDGRTQCVHPELLGSQAPDSTQGQLKKQPRNARKLIASIQLQRDSL